MLFATKSYLQASKSNFMQPDDVNYWSKRWDISAHQLIAAINNTKSTSLTLIAGYLRQYGFYNLSTDGKK
jgi:Protein of unknown function (DUF3606)